MCIRDRFERKLREIRRLNDDIDAAGVSADIDRLEALTRSIFAAVRNSPEKRAKLHPFMDYYLPTTLKLLTAYAQLDEQPASGRNAAEAKTRIEGILKKLVECFEQLLDQLNRFDVIDIASDIQVLETMMAKDGTVSYTHLWRVRAKPASPCTASPFCSIPIKTACARRAR